MRDRTNRTAVILLVAVMALSLPACRTPFLPQAISADLVPEDVRSHCERRGASDVVWHVSQWDWHGGLSLYAASYALTAPDGMRSRMALLWTVQIAPQLNGVGFAVGIQDGRPFNGLTATGCEMNDDPSNVSVSITAGGYCFDSRATEVVAKTTEGRELRCPVTNGFWLIVVNDAKPAPNPVAAPLEHWADITARSSSGKVLHRLDLGRPM